MTSSNPVATTRTNVTAAIALLVLAEATLFFTFLFIIGPIATPALLVPLAVVLVLCAALYWGQDWARWVLLAPIAFRMWRLVLVIAAASSSGRIFQARRVMITRRASLHTVPTRSQDPLIGNRRSHDFAEQPVLLAERTCRKEERVRRPCRRAVAERECPQPVDRQRLAIGGMELTALH